MTMLSVTIPVSGCQEAQDPLPAHLLLIFMYLDDSAQEFPHSPLSSISPGLSTVAT